MPTLKEIKGRIGSVKSTLKITSAMKLVSSAKLHKAQQAAEAMRPYEEALLQILAATEGDSATNLADIVALGREIDGSVTKTPDFEALPKRARVIVAIASNSSLCGGFNSNVIAKVREIRQKGDVVYSIGRKMADAMRRDGFPTPEDLNSLIEHPTYGPAAALVEKFMEEQAQGKIGEVLLVYTHFVSTARQVPTVEVLLPSDSSPAAPVQNDKEMSSAASVVLSASEESPDASDFIIEPGRKALREALEPKTLKLKLYAALLDSAAAEHAARTVAMQTATDNAENLLAELTLQYNKGRQQKITSEILDLAGGQSSD
jgi:F-type H+-transporting ATPase subunit gamma